jgi:hypothetical protein
MLRRCAKSARNRLEQELRIVLLRRHELGLDVPPEYLGTSAMSPVGPTRGLVGRGSAAGAFAAHLQLEHDHTVM